MHDDDDRIRQLSHIAGKTGKTGKAGRGRMKGMMISQFPIPPRVQGCLCNSACFTLCCESTLQSTVGLNLKKVAEAEAENDAALQSRGLMYDKKLII